MTPAQWRRLRRYVCGLCEQRLDVIEQSQACHALFEPRCPQEARERRRDACLAAARKPRVG
jgi:hypothetical protein